MKYKCVIVIITGKLIKKTCKDELMRWNVDLIIKEIVHPKMKILSLLLMRLILVLCSTFELQQEPMRFVLVRQAGLFELLSQIAN